MEFFLLEDFFKSVVLTTVCVVFVLFSFPGKFKNYVNFCLQSSIVKLTSTFCLSNEMLSSTSST